MSHLQFKLSLFWSAVISLIVTYLFLEYGVPYATMLITGREQWMPVPRTAMAMFMILAVVGAMVYVSTSDEKIEEFREPVLAFLRGDQDGRWSTWAKWARVVCLAAFPFLLGGFVYFQTRLTAASPTTLRIQHPTIPGAYEKLKNPLRNPDGTVKNVKFVEEGGVLYQKNCRPCHGTTAAGDGPMGWGFRLKPVSFRDPGTIATLVEAYLFWRIKEGAAGLPPEASPWDSAMPAWKEELSDEEIWKIILAEFDTAGVEPRKPEKLE
ncbi:MAG: cytochrome c [Deltaproteobacteria bacterium]|nr:cytochrome c [Deltaproteobacteria bacterium]